jgi:hypothetical protein
VTDIDTKEFFGAVLKAIACTRNHSDDDSGYAAGVVEPAAKIRALEAEVGDRPLTPDEVGQVLGWLESTFRTKRTPDEERQHYLDHITEVAGLDRVPVAAAG